MTQEGIIQKVFKPYIISQITGALRTDIQVDDVIKLQQELIKEIDKEFRLKKQIFCDCEAHSNRLYAYTNMHRILIGDTKE